MGGLLSSPSQSHIISASYLRFPPWPTTTAPYVQCINADFLAIVFAYFVFSSLTSISIGVLITHLVRNKKTKNEQRATKNVATNMAQQQWIGWLTKIAPTSLSINCEYIASHDAERILEYSYSTMPTLYEHCVQFCFRLCNYYKNKLNYCCLI